MKYPNGDDKQVIASESQWIISLPEETFGKQYIVTTQKRMKSQMSL